MLVTVVLTPTRTPPLDTAEEHTRPVVQLVGITDTGAGYTFDFSRLDRWLGICRDLGMRSLEIAHLFTQWGARFTPAIQVRTTERSEERRVGKECRPRRAGEQEEEEMEQHHERRAARRNTA